MSTPAEKKEKKGRGRPKGSSNIDRQWLIDRARAMGADPFQVLLLYVKSDWKGLGYDSPTVTRYSARGQPYEEDQITGDQRIASATALIRHMLPTLKAVDVNLSDDKGPISVTVNLSGNNESNKPKPTGTDSTPDETPK